MICYYDYCTEIRTEVDLVDSFKHKGIWWLPDNEGPQFIGTLSFDPENGGKLELTHLITDHSQPPAFRFSRNYDIIFGVARGAQVTLVGPYLLKEAHALPDLRIYEFSISSIHFNRQVGSAEEMLFEESSLSYSHLTLSFTHLDEWIGPVGFVEEDGCYRRERFEPIVAELADTNDKLTFWYGNSRRDTAYELSMKNQARITIERRDHYHISNYQWYTDFSLAHLLTLATGEPNFPSKIVAITKDGNFSTNIFYKTDGYTESTKSVRHEDMLFNLSDLGNNLPGCISAWNRKYYPLWFTTDLYVQTVYNPTLRATTKFLLLAQALESYHTNSNHDDKYMQSSTFKRIAKTIRGTIPESVNEPLLGNLRSRINGANKYSLRSRLLAICELLSAYDSHAIAEVVGDHEKFAKAVKELRDQLTHHPVKGSKQYAELLQSGLKLTKSMEVLLRLCLLTELELPDEKTSELMRRFVNKSKARLEPVW